MIDGKKFWISMALFQVVFGLAVFGATRQYYIVTLESFSTVPATTSESSRAWSDVIMTNNMEQFTQSMLNQSSDQDPVKLSFRANEFFASNQYDRAAVLYEQLLGFDPKNAEIYNNLGITLHYIGRSAEAIVRLNEGVMVDPTYQRIWLTLGFVNSELGNTEQARTALGSAIRIDADSEVGQSAEKMLENLPRNK